jgi:uncharacterized protein YqfB (UPF0267 family)
MSFKLWSDDPFTAATEVNRSVPFTTTGSTATFSHSPLTTVEVGATIQYSNVKKRLYDGGFEKNEDDTITINVIPPADQQGVIPGIGTIPVPVHDQATVDGIANSNIKEVSIYFGDIDDIHINYYVPRAASGGIEISFVNLITSGGNPGLSIVQLACCDSSGSALTYAATGAAIYTDQLAGFSTLAASAAQGSTTLQVTSASSNYYFIAGDFIKVNTGNDTQEIRRISSISYNTITLSEALSYNHSAGETVYSCIREVKAKFTIPEDMTNGEAENFYNLVPKFIGRTLQRP